MAVRGNIQTEGKEGEQSHEQRILTMKALLDRVSTKLKMSKTFV